jgi:MFS family permease
VLGLLVIMFVVGWFITPAQAATQTILQSATSDAMRGRVIGAFQASMSTTTIVSTAAAGVFAGIVGVRTVFLVGGGICLVAAAISWLLFRADRARTPELVLAPGATVEVGPAVRHVAEA